MGPACSMRKMVAICVNTRSSGIKGAEGVFREREFPTGATNSHVHHTWQMLSGNG